MSPVTADVAPIVSQKDGPGPVMVSDTLCPAVHIFSILKLKQGSGPEGDDVL